ncbi:MAG TPA: DUF4157 domain-containing protein [Pyrinomonadaceae bacterium]|nr:DUF4157 domain-containing protein [Pyrinomonadaceae bacterium]
MTRNANTTREQEQTPLPRKPAVVNSVAPAPSGLLDLQRDAGNQTVSEWLESGLSPRDNSAGVVQTKSKNGGAEGIAERQADQAAEQATQATRAIPAKSLLVDDDSEQLQAGQMRKSEFLGQLRPSVCAAAEQSLAGTMWASIGCPYIVRWFDHFDKQPAARVERALLKYAPEAAAARSARDYIPIVTQRVGQGIADWRQTGEMPGLPEEFAGGEMPGATVAGLFSGALAGIGSAVSGGLSSVGSMLFKRRDGDEREAEDPEAIRDQLGAGHALDGHAKTRLQSAFGADFSDVRVHTDGTAQQLADGLNAHAFTIGSDIAFGPGEYRPGTVVGDALIAHELAHVVQQGGSKSFEPQGNTSSSELDADADLSALGAMVSISSGTVAPQTKPRRRSGLSLQLCSCGKSEQTKTPESKKKAAQETKSTTKAEPADDWDFTPADYEALSSGGKKLKVSSDSAWFPAPLQENLLATLNFLLGPTKGPRGTHGVNIRDFYHGHVVIKKQKEDDFLPENVAGKVGTYFAHQKAEYTKALGKEFNPVTQENLPEFTQAVKRTSATATDLLNEALKEKGVAIVYHTFEERKHRPSDIKSGDPRRNYVTPLDTNKPESFSPPNPDSANSYSKQYAHVFEFGFLIDRNGEVHIRPGSIREFSTFTGKPEDTPPG